MNKYVFYDYDEAEKIRDQHTQKWLDLYRKFHEAKEKGNAKAIERARNALKKHDAKGAKLKRLAEATGFYWYP